MESAELFQEETLQELEALAMSFQFEQCVQRETLNGMMSKWAKV
jgi:hypothetical protein